MAPPKRKTGGGRVTPKGTRPAGNPTKSTKTSKADDVSDWHRSTAPEGHGFRESKPWAPYVAGAFLGGGVVAIIVNNLTDLKSPWMILGAITALMIGLWALTKW